MLFGSVWYLLSQFVPSASNPPRQGVTLSQQQQPNMFNCLASGAATALEPLQSLESLEDWWKLMKTVIWRNLMWSDVIWTNIFHFQRRIRRMKMEMAPCRSLLVPGTTGAGHTCGTFVYLRSWGHPQGRRLLWTLSVFQLGTSFRIFQFPEGLCFFHSVFWANPCRSVLFVFVLHLPVDHTYNSRMVQ